MEEAPERLAKSPARRRRGTRRRARTAARRGWSRLAPKVTLLLDRAPDDGVSGDRDHWRPGRVDHVDLRGSACARRRRAARRARRATATRSRARSIAGLRDRFVPTAAAAGCSGRSGGARSAMSRSRSRPPTSRWPSTTSAPRSRPIPFERGPVREQRPRAAAHLGCRLAHGPALRARDLHGHAVLGTAAVRRRHAHPGPALALRRRRRPAREKRDRAVRRVAPARRPHPEPLPDDAAADHPAVLAVLDRDDARPLQVGRRRTFPKPYLRGARGVLDWFEARLAPSGLLGRLEWWNFADWVEGAVRRRRAAHRRRRRVRRAVAAVRARAAGGRGPRSGGRQRRQAAQVPRARPTKSLQQSRRAAGTRARACFADTPSKRTFSQHANLLAVLAGLVPASRTARVHARCSTIRRSRRPPTTSSSICSAR